jgi:transposase
MGKKIYDTEFKQTIVSLLESGKTVLDLSVEYGVSLASINRWKKQYSKVKGLTPEKPEFILKLKALEKELKEVKLERDILKKAVSIFSKSDR